MSVLRIATRKSPLALWQAEHVRDRLLGLHSGLDVELVPMSTQGDRMLDAPLAKVGGKGLFVKELENALLDGRADIAVHSMKDVPVGFPDGLHLAVIMERADPRDALVSSHHASLAELPPGARLGTSILRRRCQILAVRPDLDVINLRGGVGTRLRKLDDGDYDAIVLACAGLQRLEMPQRIAEALAPEVLLPAIGQGVLGIECRSEDARTNGLIAPLACPDGSVLVGCERSLNARLGGGCQVPIAAHAVFEGDDVWLRALVASPDGQLVLREDDRAEAAAAEALGVRVGERLLARGAEAILAAVYADA